MLSIQIALAVIVAGAFLGLQLAILPFVLVSGLVLALAVLWLDLAAVGLVFVLIQAGYVGGLLVRTLWARLLLTRQRSALREAAGEQDKHEFAVER